MAFAVIQTGGKQYQVSSGSVISVEKLVAEAGETIVFDKVLLFQDGGEPVLGLPMIEGATVTAQVIAQRKGVKLRISTYKAKKRQSRTMGHRQQLTQVKITGISVAPAKKSAAKE